MRQILAALIALGSLCPGLLADRSAAAQPAGSDTPMVIAHRGASGLYPEHTLLAYEAAIDMGADAIEPDLVMTKDGHLIARHERYLSLSTDIAERPEFAARRTEKRSGTELRSDWWAEDFTLAEIKSLRARQTREGRPSDHDGALSIPTFTEILGLAAVVNSAGQRVAVYPEIKEPGSYADLGFDIGAALLEALRTAGDGIPVYIQSFEPWSLRALADRTDHPLVQLLPVTTGETLSLQEIARYADAVGPWKQHMARHEGGIAGFIADAHAAGLAVHAWTYRDDAVGEGFGSIEAELTAAFGAGLDGVFTDFPDTALRVRDGR